MKNTSKLDVSELIAEAKSIKETALANAKLALEEAFVPKLQSMISAKLQNEVEDDEDIDVDLSNGTDDVQVDDFETSETPEGDVAPEPVAEPVAEPATNPVAEPNTEVAPTVAPENGEVSDDEVKNAEEPTDEEFDIELENAIAELEDDIDGDNIDVEDDTTEDDFELENSEMSNIDSELESVEFGKTGGSSVGKSGKKTAEDDDEEFNLDEILASLEEEEGSDELDADDNDGSVENEEEVEQLKTELHNMVKQNRVYESKINQLSKTLNEVNLLNSKLLYTTRLFRKYDLNNDKKVRVIESFDRAKSVREVKLVYTTVAEALKNTSNKKVTTNNSVAKKLTENIVKTDVTTFKTNVIKESTKTVVTDSIVDPIGAARLQKLAGLTKFEAKKVNN